MKPYHLQIWGVCATLPLLLSLRAQVLTEPFDYPNGELGSASGGAWVVQTAGSPLNVSDGAAVIDQADLNPERERVSRAWAVPFRAAAGAKAYFSLTATWTALPLTPTGSYFLHLSTATDGNTFYGRLGANTDGAADGRFRVSVANANWSQANGVEFPQDLSLNVPYAIVVRYDLANGTTTLWLNPETEESSNVTATDPPAGAQQDIGAISLRQGLSNSSTGAPGVIRIDNLLVGSTFGEVTASSPPEITVQPADVTVEEGDLATFTVGIMGAASLQWTRNDQPIPGAHSATLNYGPVVADDEGAQFGVTASNRLGQTNSATAVLHVVPDRTPPTLVSAVNVNSTTVELAFSEPIALLGAEQAENYVFDPDAPVLSATLSTDFRHVVLSTTPLLFGLQYTVTINHLTDRSQAANSLAPDTRVSFVAADLVTSGIGDSSAADQVVPLPGGGYAVTSGGVGIKGGADQLRFAWQLRSGDFDQKVRVEALDRADVWSQAALMVRESGAQDARFAAVVATPGPAGASFSSRANIGGVESRLGSFPVNYPRTWLRLRRVGNTFSGYAGFDGQEWALLGSVSLALPASVQVGLAAGAHNTNQPVTARFQDLGDASSGVVIPSLAAAVEPLGPSSRKTGLALSEIQFQAPVRTDGRHLEFVELYNSNPWPEEIGGYRLDGDFQFTFPPGTTIAGGGYLVVAAAPADLQSVYGLSGILGPFSRPSATTGLLRLYNNGRTPALYLEIPYQDFEPWYTAAAGTGHSLVLAHPSFGEGRVEAWSVSQDAGGSPGRAESYWSSPLRSVVLNEFLAHPANGRDGYVELYNHGSQGVDLSGCRVRDFPGTNEYVLPPGSELPAGEFLALDRTQLGFGPDRRGGSLFLLSPGADHVLDVVTFEAQEQGVAYGRIPDGGTHWYRLQSPTRAAGPGTARVDAIVINELMYKPLSRLKEDEYVELYNQSSGLVDLSGWEFTHGLKFTFPDGTALAPGGYLVVAKDPIHLRANYPGLTLANTLGGFGGSLSGQGERVALAQPRPFVEINPKGNLVTNFVPVIVDEVTYGTGGRWGNWSDAGGSSLELKDPRADHRSAGNWGDSDETSKSEWTTLEATSHLDLGSTQGGTPIDRLEILLSGEGECLVDNVEVIESVGGTNLLSKANSTFESGLGGWVAKGDHVQSFLENSGGIDGGQCLHVRATDRGDTLINHIRVPLTKALKVNQTVTLRAQVRWLRGFPEMVLRVKGNYAEATGSFHPPVALGTPGTANSRWVANAGPTISEVQHSPPMPADRQPVVVSAVARDPDGLSQVVLRYRVDPATTYSEVSMKDDGTGGDAVADDGVFSATIPGRTAGSLVAFEIQATDAAAQPLATAFPEDAPNRECLVRFGEPTPRSGFGSYHLWLTKKTADRWTALRSVSNERHDGTFVYGNSRVIYNVRGKFAGSPYHQGFGSPLSNNCHYSLEMPADDPLLGATAFNKIHAPGNGPWEDDTLQREQTAYWMVRQLGLPWNYRRYVNFFINGGRRQPSALMEDTQTPNSDVVAEQFPDDTDGFLYKLQPWFEFADDGQTFDNKGWCTLNNYLSGGVKKLARYRPNYLTRNASVTANNYTNVFQLIDTANLPVNTPALRARYVESMDALIDTEEWLRIMAVEHAVGNWDSFLNSNGQNMYAYKPAAGRWTLFIWDYNIVLGLGGYSDGPTGDSLFKTTGGDNGIMDRFAGSPGYRRILWRAYEELANRWMINEAADPLINARYAAFQTEGIAASSPTSLKSWIRSRHNYLLSQLKTVATPFTIANGGGTDFETADNPLILTGTAPITVQDLEVNGVVRPVTWTDVKHWQLTLPLTAATTRLEVRGLDRDGQPVAGSETRQTVTFTGELESPVGRLVLNEVMYHSPSAGAEYVELFNGAAHTPFDLTFWRIAGLDYPFPAGTTILPGTYLVVARNRTAFAAAYGPVPIVGESPLLGDAPAGELRLMRPGPTAAEDEVVSALRFRNSAPWPIEADGLGPSLQLIDPTQDTSRPANWAARPLNSTELFTPGRANSVQTSLPPFPDVWINEVLPTHTSGSLNGGLEPDPLVELVNRGTNTLDLGGYSLSSSYQDLNGWSFPPGTSLPSGAFLVIHADGQPNLSTPTVPHTSFRLDTQSGSLILSGPPGTSPETPVLDYLDYQDVGAGQSFGSLPDGQSALRQRFRVPTPGTGNSGSPGSHPVFLNEWMASNTSFLTNNSTGLTDDWFELFNASEMPIDLEGFQLSNPSTSLSGFPIPAGTRIPPHGFLLVWADKNPAANAPGGPLHVNFKLNKDGASVGLFAPDGFPVDDVSFGPQTANVSEGRAPDGSAGPYRPFVVPSPSAENLPLKLQGRRETVPESVRLAWESQPGIRYRLAVRETLEAPWDLLSEPIATGTTTEYLDDPGEDGERYFQLFLAPAD